MLAVIKIAKMKPWGIRSPAGLRAGVQRNTKVYMDASKRAWLAPSNATRASAGKQNPTAAMRQEVCQAVTTT
jgi:hypothetical protein